MLQAHPPDALEDTRPGPGLEAQVTGTAGTILAGNHLPLATGPQDVQDAVEYGPIGYRWPAIGARRLVGGQDGFDQFPQLVRNLAESIPLLGFLTHRNVLHDVTIAISVNRKLKHEGFRTHS